MSNSSSESKESANNLHTPIDVLLSVPAGTDLTESEVTQVLAATANYFRKQEPALWDKFLQDMRLLLVEHQDKDLQPKQTKTTVRDDLEETYTALQNSLISLRMSVAQAIAAEKHLELQFKKSQDQADTWAERAKLAVEQKNLELADQAKQRGQQYIDAASQLKEQLDRQKKASISLRQRLSDVEVDVQKTYTKKQVLVAREHAARAHIRANELIAAIDCKAASERLDELAQKVVELEEAASASPVELPDVESDERRLLLEVTAALERSVAVIKQLEERLLNENGRGAGQKLQSAND